MNDWLAATNKFAIRRAQSLGIAMIAAGLILMIGWLERLAQFVATPSVLVPMVLVIRNSPGAWHDPYGGLAKDACLFACSAVVWFLSPITRQSQRA